MRWLAALLLVLLPVSALSESFPALYDVVGVASDDVLNIRAEPSGNAALTGAFAFDATGAEVIRLSDDGQWGQVNSGGTSGWAFMRYMVRQAGQDNTSFPLPVVCMGTEPFWNVTLHDDGAILLDRADDTARNFITQARLVASGRRDRFSVIALGESGPLHAVIARSTCNDGMSDREYGLTIDLILNSDPHMEHLTGCCSLSR